MAREESIISTPVKLVASQAAFSLLPFTFRRTRMAPVATAASEGTLTISPRIEARLHAGELTSKQVDDFRDFLGCVNREFFQHRVITSNEYSRWFQQGKATDEELKHFIKQFSVFSNQFLVAALLKVINAPSLQQARASKEILMNELGVIYRKHGQPVSVKNGANEEELDREGDPELVSTEGTVDGGICRFRAAHFEWLIGVGAGLGLTFHDLGKRQHGRATTLHFCDELQRLYGSEDGQIAEGASFAVENWAAAGFWQELEDGLMKIKKARHPQLRLAFFTWHNRVEAQHATHTMDELEDVYFNPGFGREKFFQGGKEILDAVAVFWDGLNQDRVNRVYT
jgi:hypothetical protein